MILSKQGKDYTFHHIYQYLMSRHACDECQNRKKPVKLQCSQISKLSALHFKFIWNLFINFSSDIPINEHEKLYLKRIIHTLLIEVLNGAITLRKSLAVSYRVKNMSSLIQHEVHKKNIRNNQNLQIAQKSNKR